MARSAYGSSKSASTRDKPVKQKKRKSKSKSSSSQPSPQDLDATNIDDAFNEELSDTEYEIPPARRQSQRPLQPLRGKEQAIAQRKAEEQQRLTEIRSRVAQNSRSERPRKSRQGPEPATDSDSSGSDSDVSDKENMTNRTKAQAEATAKAAAEEAARLAVKAASLETENARLKKSLKVAEKNSAKFEPTLVEKKTVETKVKYVMFCKYQFNIKLEDTTRITTKLYMKLHSADERKANGLDGKNQWIKSFTPIVGETMIKTRGYRSQELRKVCLEYARVHRTLPSLGMMIKCMTGDIDLKSDVEKDAYHWYWTQCMPVAAMGNNWAANKRNFTLMNEAKSQYDATTVLFTPELKTFFYLMFDNRREGWILGGNYLADNPGVKKLEKEPTKVAIKEAEDEGRPLDMRIWASKYTCNDLGKVSCGWKPEAFTVKDDIQAQVEAAHENHWDRLVQLEKDFLPILQAKENIKVQKAAKRHKTCPLKDLVVNDFSTDEEDEYEEV